MSMSENLCRVFVSVLVAPGTLSEGWFCVLMFCMWSFCFLFECFHAVKHGVLIMLVFPTFVEDRP